MFKKGIGMLIAVFGLFLTYQVINIQTSLLLAKRFEGR